MNNNQDKKHLKHNTIALLIIQILNYIIPFITLPYITRIFRVEEYGVIIFAQVTMEYFYRFIMFGFDFSAVRQIAIHSGNKKNINHIFNSVLVTQILFIILGSIILGLLLIFVPKLSKYWLIYLYTYLGTIGFVFTLGWFYQGIARMKFVSILNIITRTISLILIFTCIKKADDYILYPLLNSISMITAAIVSIIFLRKIFDIKFYVPKIRTIIKTVKYSSQFFLTKVAISLYRGTNAFVLGIVVTSTAVAYYVAADKIFWAVFFLYYTFIQALFPYMSKNKDIVFFKKMLKYLICLTIGATIFLLISSKYLILIFYSAKYLESVKILQIFSMFFPFMLFVDILGFPLLGAFGYVRETNRGYIFGGLYNCIGLLILYLLNQINIYSVAILVSSTYLVMFIHRIYYIIKYRKVINGEVV